MPIPIHKLQSYEQLFEQHLRQLASRSEKSELQLTPDFMSERVQETDPQVRKRIEEEFFGLGPLSQILNDPTVTEIMTMGPDRICFERSGKLGELADAFVTERSYLNFIERFAFENRINTDHRRPSANGLWNSWRFHLLTPPVVKLPCLTLRRHRESTFTLGELLTLQWAPAVAVQELQCWVLEKRNLLIVGPTNTGKTSLIGAMLQELPANERVLILEDTDEIKLPNFCSSKLLTREKFNDDVPSITLSDLVTESLRMRPDRLVLGEMRGAEAKDYLLALSTGHAGSLATLHAGDPRQALIRLEFLIQMGAPHWSSLAIRQLIHTSIYGIVVLENRDGKRKLKGLYRMASLESTGFCLDNVYQSNVV